MLIENMFRNHDIQNIVDIETTDPIRDIEYPLRIIGVHTKGKVTWIECVDSLLIPAYIKITYGLNGSIKETSDNWKIKFTCDSGPESTFEWYYCGGLFGGVTIELNMNAADRLGIDILDPITEESKRIVLHSMKRHNRMNVCGMLLQQDILCGIGNYLKSEILFACGISPHAKIGCIPDLKLIEMYEKANEISFMLLDCLLSEKSCKRHLKVYQKSICDGNPVVSEKIRGRQTFWIPELQKFC